MWQSGQYRAPVIKPLPVKHPAIIDEFPLGKAELSLGLEGQERGILEDGTSPGMLKSICEGKAIFVTLDSKTKTKKQEAYWL